MKVRYNSYADIINKADKMKNYNAWVLINKK